MRGGSVIAECGFKWCEGVWWVSALNFWLYSGRWQGVRRVLCASTCEEGTGTAPAASYLLANEWNCLQILVSLLPHSHPLHTLLELFPPVQRGSTSHLGGLQHCLQSLGQPLGAALLKCWLRYLGEQRGAVGLYVWHPGQSFVRKHVQRSVCSGLESCLLIMDPGLEHKFCVPMRQSWGV